MSLSVHNFKPKNLVRQKATESQKEYWKEIIPYGDDDNFPLRLAELVQNSPTGSSCIDTKTDFIEGAGFSDSTLGDKIINGLNERFGDLHHTVCESLGLYEGFALNVKYNAKGNITEIYNIPFEYCRFGIPDDKGVISKIKVNPTYGTISQYKQEWTKTYDVFNHNKKVVLAQQARDGSKYLGQILYVASTSPISRFYPSPKYYSCHKWMGIEEAIASYEEGVIENGFFQSILFKMIGDENQPSTHPDDMKFNETTQQYEPDPKKTVGMRFNDVMQKFAGSDKAGNVMVLWAAIKEAMPEITSFPTASNTDLFKALMDVCTEIIARGTKVPSILANISSGASLGGDGNNIRASVKLMQQRVIKVQAMLERVYKNLLSLMEEPFKGDVKIIHYNPFPEMEKIDQLVWEALTSDERRNWIKKNTEFELQETVQPVTTAPTNKFSNISYSSYPEKAKEKAKKAKDHRDKTGSNCGGKGGWLMTDDIISGKPLSYKSIKRIHNYLKKNESFKNHVFSDSCESLLYSAWGGDEMLSWSQQIINSINE